jgi:hypothetical protein
MKFGLILLTLILCQTGFAQTQHEINIKKEMVDRVELLISKVEEARDDLDKHDASAACKKIQEIFVIFPDHLKAIGTHLDLFKSKDIKAKDDALEELIYFHRESLVCKKGKDSEYVDSKDLDKKLKNVLKALKKQKKLISKSSTDYENSFSYEYEFQN